MTAETRGGVVIHDADALQPSIDDGGPHELEAALLQVLGDAFRELGGCGKGAAITFDHFAVCKRPAIGGEILAASGHVAIYSGAGDGGFDLGASTNDAGIIRARAKIEATIAGARIYCDMARSGEDFAAYCWSFTDGKVVKGDGRTFPATTELSERISKDLKKRGFKFVGPTIVYAWLQGVGIVNDHAATCFRRQKV